MRSFAELSFYACIFIVVLFTQGCGKKSSVSPVQGIVTLDGTPVPDASVTFMPAEGGRPAFGISDAQGKYTLTTFEQGDGALHGNHLVTIMAVDESADAKAKEMAEEIGSLAELASRPAKRTYRVPEIYSDKETSGLSFEVKAGEQNQADFPLSKTP